MIKQEYKKLTEKAESQSQAIDRLVEIIEILRVECPWDREQTHKSLRVCMIEEAYEVAEAIDKDDTANLREELGDVLLQVVFHSSLAKEKNDFNLTDVVNEECEKMIRRHPHVFLGETAKTVDKVLEKWENIKVKEYGDSSCTARLKKVPNALPALIRSCKVQKKAAEVGFDWDDSSGAFAKLAEETEELIEAFNVSDKAAITEELGDLLFSVVNVSRFLGVEPEAALEQATEKFIRRFEHVETESEKSGRSIEDMSLGELNELWEKAKY